MRPVSLNTLLADVRACRHCVADLPRGPRPILQAAPTARLLIASQAPGRIAHASGVPFDDASGRRLRDWLGIDRRIFYDAARVAILPLGFCYPGRGAGGDLPPRPECAELWRRRLLDALPRIELVLTIGRYAQDYHLGATGGTLTERVRAWRDYGPGVIPLPHPSPRNNRWISRNPWFETELLPELRSRVGQLLEAQTDGR